jgi:hypothetical protein
MQKQTSALQRLSKILSNFMQEPMTQPSFPAITKLLEYINTADDSPHFMDFFTLLSTAREEIGRMKDRESSRRVIEKLNDYFINKNTADAKWSDFRKFIDDGNYIFFLNSLADHYHTQNPTIFLESDFLDGLKEQFNFLLDEIINSDLSSNFKSFLAKHIEDILYAIRRYSIDGTEGLEKATKSFVSDLAMMDSRLNNKEKENPLYKKSVSAFLALSLHFLSPNIYDILGVIPAMDEYYRPKIERFIKDRQEIEASINETSAFTEIIEKSLQLSNKQPQKNLPGKEQKSLPSAQINEEPPLEMEANLED